MRHPCISFNYSFTLLLRIRLYIVRLRKFYNIIVRKLISILILIMPIHFDSLIIASLPAIFGKFILAKVF